MEPVNNTLPPKVLGERQARIYLNIGHSKYWELIKRGELDAVLIDGSTKITRESADRLIDRGRIKAAKRREARIAREAEVA